MTYLEASGLVDGIMTEDSDLLVFGAKLVLFKFDTSGSVMAISRADFGQIHTPAVSFVGWSDVQFREMAILSGCDYLPSIQGIGIITAAKLMRKHKSAPKVLQFLRLEGTKRIPKGYLEDLRTAELAFQYQRVYDPRSQRLVHLREPPEEFLWDEVKDGYVGT
jgi:exonuclease-1